MLINNKGIQPDPERISALTDLDPPSNIREVRGWLGAVQQLNIYHPHLALYLKPVQELLERMWFGTGVQNVIEHIKRSQGS